MTQTNSLATSPAALTGWLDCYEPLDKSADKPPVFVTLNSESITYDAEQTIYELPLTRLYLLQIALYIPKPMQQVDIEWARKEAIKSALGWQKRILQEDSTDHLDAHYVLALDIQYTVDDTNADRVNNDNDVYKISKNKKVTQLSHKFGARYFLEDLIIDSSIDAHSILIYSEQDWQSIITTLKNPCDLVHFLRYHAQQLQKSGDSGIPSFDSEQRLLDRFMNSEYLFTQAIAIDSVLINHEIQDEPNAALVTMSLAQMRQNATAPMYQQHMQQAAELWEQLSFQIIETKADDTREETIINNLGLWQQQLFDESLFSRHELVRILYQYPKQTLAMQQSGYVIHQHSYASLGRHYVLIFYGKLPKGQNSKTIIQPKLQHIAQDVATRLPLVELHHVVVLGIDFVEEHGETYIDIDAWIQPTVTMTQKERQLTKQLQALNTHYNQQNSDTSKNKYTSFTYTYNSKYSS